MMNIWRYDIPAGGVIARPTDNSIYSFVLAQRVNFAMKDRYSRPLPIHDEPTPGFIHIILRVARVRMQRV